MRRYSSAVADFLSKFLGPYESQWRRDYASYRPIEEKGRDLPLRRRNDLLHVDAFPTRPTRGMRILRFFHNIHPERTRDWAVGEPFAKIVGNFTPRKLAVPRPAGPLARTAKQIATAAGLARLVPQWKRTPYDEFMMRMHNTMKEDAEFQKNLRQGICAVCSRLELDGLHRDRSPRRACRPIRAGADAARRSRTPWSRPNPPRLRSWKSSPAPGWCEKSREQGTEGTREQGIEGTRE